MSANSDAQPQAVPARLAAMDQAYTVTTNRWGRITMIISLLLATSVPFYLLFFGGVSVTGAQVLTGFLAVAATYGVFWIVEPVTYYPILGPAGMYQAFMIGNISNKLLPSAIVAQSSINARPGTRKAEFAATAAICGAAAVHVVSLLLLVGLLGTWLVSITPPEITEVARLYILPAILGGIVVQLIATLKQIKAALIAMAIAAAMVFGVLPFVPALAGFNTGIVVLLTIVVVWFARPRSMRGARTRADGDEETIGIA
ncbi:hypothetical protein [Brevibacterium album]|uniref:hypothetical protein n=1 Tax=Brevibacterium album TaxID=417948 RepID=UPI000425188A|nr:hypothetical protein [Brevibacterium album]